MPEQHPRAKASKSCGESNGSRCQPGISQQGGQRPERWDETPERECSPGRPARHPNLSNAYSSTASTLVQLICDWQEVEL